MEKIKVLAVQDPAVLAYIDPKYGILKNFPEEVEVQFDVIPWEEYFCNMMKVFQGELEYDIVMIAGHLWLRDFVEKGYIQEIKAYDCEDIFPAIAKEMRWNGKTYLSPSFCDGHMILYRKGIVKKVLGRLPEPVISVDEFRNIAEELYQAGYQTPIALKASSSEIFLDALPYLRSQGIDVYEMQNGNSKCHIEDMKEELKNYISLKKISPKDTHQYGNDEIKQVFLNKQVIMATTWSGQLGAIMQECKEKEDIGFMTLKQAWNVTWSFAINKKSKKKHICEKLLAYLRQKGIDQLVGKCCGSPVRISNYKIGKEGFSWYEVQKTMIEHYAKALEPVPNLIQKNSILYEIIYSVFNGEQELEVALENAQNRIDDL